MREVIVPRLGPNEVMDLVKQLRAEGYQQGIDFDFAYNQSRWDDFTGETYERCTVFTFYDDRYATLFALKWS